MNIPNDITKTIKDNLNNNYDFEFIARLEELTLSDIDYIEKIINIKSRIKYNIVDNTYIKIEYLIHND